MKTIEEFKNFFDNVLHIDLNMLEHKRQQTVKLIFKNILIYLGIIIALVFVGLFVNKIIYGDFFNEQEYNIPLIVAIVFSISTIILLFQKNGKVIQEFIYNFKKVIIEKIVKFINENLNYSPTEYIPPEQFIKSDIFRDRLYKYYGDDLVSGVVDKTEIKFSEIHAWKIVESDEDKRKKQPIFDGIFFIADFHKNFNGKYFILPDFAQKRFGGLGKFFQKMSFIRGKLIELENPDFEREFVVYGSDQIEARYLLSSSMMERILKLKQGKFPYLFISLVDSCLYIALPFKKKLFEPSVFRSNNDYKKTEEFFSLINDTVSIVEELNLNTRIWTKE